MEDPPPRQFGVFQTDILLLDKFATPTQKNNTPIFEPFIHQTWWEIFQPQPPRFLKIENQFGVQDWETGDARYLVLPAVKNQPGPVPPWNHYKCYDAVGPVVDTVVVLTDQFGQVTAFAVEPVFFCNPVEKEVPGRIFPIMIPEAHLACYRLQPPHPTNFPAMAIDQFGQWQLNLIDHCWLCLPTNKLSVIPVEESTWGRIKSLYEK